MRRLLGRSTVSLCLVTMMLATAAPGAMAQSRSACSDGPGNVRDQVGGTILGELLPDWIENPWAPESPDSVWDRCIEPQLRPPPAGYNPGGTGPGTNSGDPHILTQDGAKYDFHGAGDYLLLRSAENGLEMHVRYRRSQMVSLFDGVALRTAETTVAVELGPRGVPPTVTVDGEAVDLDPIGWIELDGGFLVQTGDRVFVRLDTGVTFEARRAGLSLLTPADWAGQFEGIQGNGDGDPTNDIVTDDGVPVDPADADELYGAFLESWFIDPADSLFPTSFDEEADGPIRPAEIVRIADLARAEVEAAHTECSANGLVAGAGLEECIFDVAYTGDPSWAVDVPSAARVRALPAVGFSPVIEQTFAIEADAFVGVDSPGAGAGEIGTAFHADDYTVPESEVDRMLRPSTPCDALVGPVALVIVDGSPVESLPLVCGRVHPLPKEAFVLRVIDPYGGTPSYGFAIGPAARVDLGAIEMDREYVGELQAGETAVGVLAAGPGTTVFVEPARTSSDCAVNIVLVDSFGEAQSRPRSACRSGVPVPLTGVAPFSVEITGSGDSSYRFVVSEVPEATSTIVREGEEVTLDVSSPGQLASATLELTAGQRVYIETLDEVGGDLFVTAPGGEVLATAFSFKDLGLVVADAAGTYTITVDADDALTGVQRLLVHEVDDDSVVSVGVGETVRLVVSTPGQKASATVSLDAGERVYVQTIDDVAGDVVVAGPDGTGLGSDFSFHDLGLIEATTTGLHTITIEPADAAIGTQELRVYAVPDDTSVEAELGDEVTLRITDPGQSAAVAVNLAAGEEFAIDVIEWMDGRLRVLDPTGQELHSGLSLRDVERIVATTAGIHTIVVVGTDAATGDQTLLLRPLDS